MTTLFDATLAVARKLGVLRTGTVDSGSQTTCVDATRREVDSSFNGGTIWAIDTTDDAAPKNEWAVISDYVLSTGTLTHGALSAVFGAGDTYGITTQRFPLDIIKTAINDELIKYKAPRYDATTLDVVKDQSEYTLPVGIYKNNLLNVYESTVDDDNNNRWVPLQFEVQPADSGSQHTLVVKSRRVSVDNDFLLEYMAWCLPLDAFGDVIDESIPLPRLVVHAAAQTVLIVMQTYSSSNELDMDLWKFLSKQAEDSVDRYPIRPTQRKGRVMQAGGHETLKETITTSLPS